MDQNPYSASRHPVESNRVDDVSKGWRDGWALGCWFPCRLGGIGMLLATSLGIYDPRTMDGLEPRFFPIFVAAMLGYIALSLAGSLSIWLKVEPWLLRGKPARTTIAVWVSQLLLQVVLGIGTRLA